MQHREGVGHPNWEIWCKDPEKEGPATTAMTGHWSASALETFRAGGGQLPALRGADPLLKGDLSSRTLWLPQTGRETVPGSHTRQPTRTSTQTRSETEHAGTLWSDAFKLSVNLVLVLIPLIKPESATPGQCLLIPPF